MRPADRSGTLDRVLTLLNDCAAATREARLDRLPALVTAVETSLAGMGRPVAGQEAQLRLIRMRLDENRRLLQAAERGIQAARRRIGEVTASVRTLNTYDSQGRRATLMRPADGFEGKA